MTVFFTWLFVVLVFVALHAVFYAVLVLLSRLHGKRQTDASEGRSWAFWKDTRWVQRLKDNYALFVVSNALRTVRPLGSSRTDARS